MNRAEKRNQEKIYKKKMQWAESLRPWQKEFINDALADARATIETEVVSNLDTIITAALVEKTDLSLKEIFDINVTVGEFYGRIRYENSIKGFENRMKTLASIQEEVIKKINGMIKEGKERGPIVKAIREEFKGTGLTTAEINVAYKKCLENAEKEEEYLAAKKILSIIGENVDDYSEEEKSPEWYSDYEYAVQLHFCEEDLSEMTHFLTSRNYDRENKKIIPLSKKMLDKIESYCHSIESACNKYNCGSPVWTEFLDKKYKLLKEYSSKDYDEIWRMEDLNEPYLAEIKTRLAGMFRTIRGLKLPPKRRCKIKPLK